MTPPEVAADRSGPYDDRVMRNPLMLPFAALGVAADIVRALTGIPRIVAALEAGPVNRRLARYR